MMNDSFCRIIAGEIQARPEQVDAAVRLLDEGNTVPFIARYRKEITGGLDDTQLRNLETRLSYLRELKRDVRRSSSPFPSKANSPMIWRMPSTPL